MKCIKRPDETLRNVRGDEMIRLTNYASREPKVSADVFDILHVAEELAKFRFRINRGRVGGGHTVWAACESPNHQTLAGRTDTRVK
jgi:hypothetical protein